MSPEGWDELWQSAERSLMHRAIGALIFADLDDRAAVRRAQQLARFSVKATARALGAYIRIPKCPGGCGCRRTECTCPYDPSPDAGDP